MMCHKLARSSPSTVNHARFKVQAQPIDKPLNMGMGNPLIMRQDSTNASMSTEQARRGKFVLRILSMLPLALGTGDTTILLPEVVDDLLQEQGGRHLVPVVLREDDQCIEDAFTTYWCGVHPIDHINCGCSSWYMIWS